MAHRQAPMLHKLYAAGLRRARWLATWSRGPGTRRATRAAVSALHQARRNLEPRRLLSVPHALVLVWMIILLWGERWVFDSKVEDCAWRNWEKWPPDANPHHLIFVADPQIIDPHSYPGRPWPLNPLTMLITDNYMRRSYRALQRQLHPDSLFFLGDLFDGGREWKTWKGNFVDPKWGKGRSGEEKKYVEEWHRKYGEDYWLREYQRFSDIFFSGWNAGGDAPGPWQRGRKLVASLPGNHDLGFGAQIQVPVRDRFSAFFGDVNRVDVVGNHTIVSVDTVSLSAGSSSFKDNHDLEPIYGPVNEFLKGVQATKKMAIQEELSVWHNTGRNMKFEHEVEDAGYGDLPRWSKNPGPEAADFPTILLTHVPLYRDPGTPCGPRREHWPPTKPAKGQVGPVIPDHRNAISVSAGYQYQNVLSEEDSVKLIKSVGNVVHVFSGDDHDYCELVHSSSKGNVPEITVKSFSMAMGVPTPGFVMVSLYNPVGPDGKPLPRAPQDTMQTKLCLLPNQFHTYMKYVTYVILSVVLLAIRAFLVPVLHLEPFALEPERSSAVLPVFKDKAKTEPPDSSAYHNNNNHHHHHGVPSAHSAGATSGLRSSASENSNGGARWSSKKKRQVRWGWAGEDAGGGGPRIKLEDNFYDGGKSWKAERGRHALGTLGRELWTTTWRVAWMTVLFWAYLTRKG